MKIKINYIYDKNQNQSCLRIDLECSTFEDIKDGKEMESYTCSVPFVLSIFDDQIKSFNMVLNTIEIAVNQCLSLKKEWFDINEKLPIDKSNVLVWCDDRAELAMYINKCFYNGELDEVDLTKYVTHWNYLPEAPK